VDENMCGGKRNTNEQMRSAYKIFYLHPFF